MSLWRWLTGWLSAVCAALTPAAVVRERRLRQEQRRAEVEQAARARL